MFTSSSFYSCHLRGSIHPARLRLELCFLSTSAGEDFPRRASHPSPLHIYPNSSAAAAPPPSRPSFGASQASFISASCLFCSRFHMFTANSLTAQTSRPAFVFKSPKSHICGRYSFSEDPEKLQPPGAHPRLRPSPAGKPSQISNQSYRQMAPGGGVVSGSMSKLSNSTTISDILGAKIMKVHSRLLGYFSGKPGVLMTPRGAVKLVEHSGPAG